MDESSRGEHVEEIGPVGVHRDLFAHDLARKPVPTFRDHAPVWARSYPAPARTRRWCNRSGDLCQSPLPGRGAARNSAFTRVNTLLLVHRRSGIVKYAEYGTIPVQQRTIACCAAPGTRRSERQPAAHRPGPDVIGAADAAEFA